MPIVSVVAGRQVLDARVTAGQWASARGRAVVVPAAPSVDAATAASLEDRTAPITIPGPFGVAWPCAFAYARSWPARDVLVTTTTESVVAALLTPELGVEDVQAALTGMVPVHPADGGVLDRVQEARALSPLLRSPYEGVLYYLLEARRSTRGRFLPNQRVPKCRDTGSWEVDLLADAHRIVVEIDGDQHARPDQRARDDAKHEDLGRLGYSVLRFSTDTVAANPVGVWTHIERQLARAPVASEDPS